eukprot:m.67984 g.67984  ORF g.67984 m.67984 type:complete len:66 (+) comp12182_c0_seq1:3761-3958(+)
MQWQYVQFNEVESSSTQLNSGQVGGWVGEHQSLTGLSVAMWSQPQPAKGKEGDLMLRRQECPSIF